MGEVLPLPTRGGVFLDPRGQGRSLRVSWHHDESTLVLSLWQFGQCRATFRLPTDEVPDLVRAIVGGLSEGLAMARDPGPPPPTVAFPPAAGEPPTAGPRSAEAPTAAPPTAEAPTAAPPTAEASTAAPPTSELPGASAEPPAKTERSATRATKPATVAERAERSIEAVPPLIFREPPELA